MTARALVLTLERAACAAELSETFRLWWREWMRVLMRDGGPLVHDWPQSYYPPERCESCGAVQRGLAAKHGLLGGGVGCTRHVGCAS